MAGKKVIVKRLASIENFGSMNAVLGQDRDPDRRRGGISCRAGPGGPCVPEDLAVRLS